MPSRSCPAGSGTRSSRCSGSRSSSPSPTPSSTRSGPSSRSAGRRWAARRGRPERDRQAEAGDVLASRTASGISPLRAEEVTAPIDLEASQEAMGPPAGEPGPGRRAMDRDREALLRSLADQVDPPEAELEGAEAVMGMIGIRERGLGATAAAQPDLQQGGRRPELEGLQAV